MAYDIGPRIGIQGEKEFNNQIKQINNTLKECGSEMKALTSKFSENAHGQEALAAKTKVLQKQYDTQKQKSDLLQKQYQKEVLKLRELADAYQKAQKESGENSAEAAKAETAYNRQAESVSKLKVALNETEGYMNNLSNAIKNNEEQIEKMGDKYQEAAEKMKNASEKTKAFGEKADAAGRGLMPVSAGIAAFGAAAVKSFNDVDEGADTIIKKTGATGDAAKELEGIFKDVFGSFPADAQEVGNAIGEINTRFGFTDEVLKNASVDFLKFARINDIDVNSAVQLVSRAMGDAGIEADEYGTLLDQLTSAAQNSGISIDKLTENLTKYGAPMRQLGFDTESSIAIFAQWEKAGVNTEIAFSGMKKAIANWTKEGKNGKEEFANFVKGVQDGSISAQEALEVFGTKAGPDLVDAIQQGRFSYEDFLEIIKKSDGIVDSTFDGVIDGSDKAKVAINSAKEALGEVGAAIMETLAPILEEVAGKLREFSEWWGSLGSDVQEFIIKVAGMAMIVAPVLIAIGKIASGISAVQEAISLALPFLGELGGVMTGTIIPAIGGALAAAAPVIAVIAGIVAAIVGVIAVIKNWDSIVAWFKENVGGAIDAIKGFFGGLGEKISETKDKVVGKITEMKDNAVEKFQNMRENVSEKFDAMKEKMATAIGNAKDKVVEKLSGVKDAFFEKLGDSYTTAKEKMSQIKDAFSEKMSSAKDIVKGAIDKIKGFFDFSWKLPKLELPHFSVSGKFGINPPSVPHFSIDWHKNGAILKGAQIFGRMGNRLLGGGEAGTGGEAVLPLRGFYRQQDQIIRKNLEDFEKDYSGATSIEVTNITEVYVGNKEFKHYITKTAREGITGEEFSRKAAKGKW